MLLTDSCGNGRPQKQEAPVTKHLLPSLGLQTYPAFATFEKMSAEQLLTDGSYLQKILDTMMGIHSTRRRGCDLFRIPGPGSPGQCHGLKSHIDAKVMNNNAGQLLD
jgi:hypothetical protein